jgi:Glutathione-dependent formaldehyde-activating enzyme
LGNRPEKLAQLEFTCPWWIGGPKAETEILKAEIAHLVSSSPCRVWRSGGCACGSTHYQLLAKLMFVHCCHCADCQRLTGGTFVLNAITEIQTIKLLLGKPAVLVARESGPVSSWNPNA